MFGPICSRSAPPPEAHGAGNDAGAGVMQRSPQMNARINRLLDELDGLRRAAAADTPLADPQAVATRIAAIEAELERANYQFHCVAVRG